MRVLYVNSMRSIGGGERWLLEVVSGLADRGHEAAFVVREGSALASRVRELGNPLLELPMRGDADPGSIFALAKWIRKLEPDLVSVNVQRAVRVGAAAARLAGVRAVVERRGLLFPLRPYAVNRFVYGRLVSRVIANCAAIAESVVETGLVDESRVTVIPNGIDVARAATGGGEAVRRELGIAREAPVVAVVGRLAPDKGHTVAVRAFAEVVRELPSARLVVAGAGKLMPKLRATSSELLPDGSAHLLGHRDDIGAVMDAADVVLVTSFREGMPHVVLEAMSAGTPVVATAVAGIPEMLRDEVDGLLTPPGLHTPAASAVLRLLTDRELAAALAGSARRRVESEFSLDAMLDRVERCFQNEAESVGRGGRAA